MWRGWAAVLLVLAAPVRAGQGADGRAPGLAGLVAGMTPATSGLSGLAVVVAGRDGVVRAEAHGDAVIGVRPLTVETPMRVASISKLVVAIIAWQLVEQGRLDMDADVSDVLGWRLRHPAFPQAAITMRMLLSHTSGLVDGPGYSFPLEEKLRDALTPAHWGPGAPGGRFEYANLGYGMAASVLEALTKTRFDVLARARVLAPLGLDAGYNWQGVSDAGLARAAVLYRRGTTPGGWVRGADWLAQVDDLRNGRPACPVRSEANCDLEAYRPGDNGTIFGPQGSLRISALGLAKLGRMLLNGGEVDGVRLLAADSVRQMKAPVWVAGGGVPGDDYGGQMLCYAAGPQCLSGRAGASDQPVPNSRWWGHLGEAYGLLGGLWVDEPGGRVIVYLLTGSAEDPFSVPKLGSAFSAVEELIMRDLARTRPDLAPARARD